jgi:esterase/lipase superfamily enzyme
MICLGPVSCAQKPDKSSSKKIEATAAANPSAESKSDAPVVILKKVDADGRPLVIAKRTSPAPPPAEGGSLPNDSTSKASKEVGTTSSDPPAAPPSSPTTDSPPTRSNAELVKVLFGTNRRADPAIRTRVTSDEQRRRLPFLFTGSVDRLKVGVAEISVPRVRKVGDSPKAGQVGRSDPGAFFLLMSVTPDSSLFESTLDAEASGATDEAIVFIHGYNVPFADAMFRAAQIKVDLGFQGPMLAFSWPSQGMAVFYREDEAIAESDATRDALFEFLRLSARSTKVKRIHVVAHSMGNRPTQRALAKLTTTDAAAKLGEIVFAAPDVNTKSDWFLNEVLPRFSEIGCRRTLYSSHADVALVLSSLFHFGKRRLGEDIRESAGLSDLQSVDASVADTSLLGHSYYGDVPAIIDDVRGVIQGLSPEDRQLIVVDRASNRWSFKIANPALPIFLQSLILGAGVVAAFFLGRWSKRRAI